MLEATGTIPLINQPDRFWNRYATASGGNHYALYDEPSEGCLDDDAEGFCDAPYAFPGGTDPRPRIAPYRGRVL